MLRDLEESTEWRRRRWTKRLWGTTIKEKQRSTSHRKVIQNCSIPQIWLLFTWHLTALFCTHIQITPRDLEESTEWRRRKWTKLLWATIIKARRRNISHRKVRKHSTCVSIKNMRELKGSQTDQIYLCLDYSAGFGGRYGVQADRMDKVGITAATIPYCPDSSISGLFICLIHLSFWIRMLQNGTKSLLKCFYGPVLIN